MSLVTECGIYHSHLLQVLTLLLNLLVVSGDAFCQKSGYDALGLGDDFECSDGVLADNALTQAEPHILRETAHASNDKGLGICIVFVEELGEPGGEFTLRQEDVATAV